MASRVLDVRGVSQGKSVDDWGIEAGPTVEGSGRHCLKSTTLVTSALGWGDCWGQLEVAWNRLGWRGGRGSYFTEKFTHDVGKGRGKVV